ncbi:hypothetical protein K492DRAFT_151405 [Lichtheimia hyalospora FSU 10163]|nr:hypothetical protein K492DRAFT_151405 [Lichtheimia hyalospora FSU 10163]
MKFSLAATSALLLTTFATLARADEYAEAIAEWCDGLSVVAPNKDSVVVAGGLAKVTVNREPDDRKKTITGLDLYSVAENGDAKYIQNVWSGDFALNKQASISDTVPSNATAGLYYYRVWVTNDLNGMHGPDCLETSHTFRVTSGVHKNADGMSYYTESLDDIQFYRPEYFKGCFGLKVNSPAKDQKVKLGKHVTISASRDKTSQTAMLKKVDLYKSVSDNEAKFVETVWSGKERFYDEINIKDHLVLDDEHLDHDATYYYTLSVSSNKAKDGDDDCTFHSAGFKIEKSD